MRTITSNAGRTSDCDCGWVDYVQSPMPSDWNSISYVYDPSGRRIEKKYDGQAVMKYLYDGDSILAEYDATGALVHKYIYGPGIDQPICMIDASDANATYYYHFDGLGSVIALTDSSGALANLYEYSIFGEVSASDPNHPNRFLFTGREFDSETGLYYYRARYYNPYVGRFLQTDPIGYGYAYCANDPVGLCDPSGCEETDPLMGWGWVGTDPEGKETVTTYTIKSFQMFGDLLGYQGVTMPTDWVANKLYGEGADNWTERPISVQWAWYRGVKVVRIDGINMLTSMTLDAILRNDDVWGANSFHEVNQWNPLSKRDELGDAFDFQTSFRDILKLSDGSTEKWLYYDGYYEVETGYTAVVMDPVPWYIYTTEMQHVGDFYASDEINYIIAGHAMARLGIPMSVVGTVVLACNIAARGLMPDEPSDKIGKKMWWATKGYDEYSHRSDW